MVLALKRRFAKQVFDFQINIFKGFFMYNKDLIPLLVAVVSLIASIIAFILPPPEHRNLRIIVGVVLLFVAIILGAWGTSLLVLNSTQARIEEDLPTPEALFTSTNTPLPSTQLPTSTLVLPTDTPLPTNTPMNISVGTDVPTDTPTPMPNHTPTTTPTVPPPTPTPTPLVIAVTVPSNSETGVRIDVTASGWYQLKYVKGAFSPWPEGDPDSRGWATHIQAFVNREIEWGITSFGLPGPVNFDAYIGAEGYYSTVDGAVNATSGKIANLRQLKAGDYVNLVVVDERGQYDNNRGNVEVALIRISP